jgi:hypothetical protein
MKKEARGLLTRSLDSLFHAIEQFNRPHDRGRPEAVLIFLDRAFELLLKGVIIARGGRIREKREKVTIGFDKCVRKCLTEAPVKCLSEEEALSIQSINSLRDAAQHYILSISEQHLYMHAQAGLTLYNRLLFDVFGQKLEEYFPERVLPVTTRPPADLASVIQAEFDDIKALSRPKSRKRLEARAKLRSIAIMEASMGGERSYPTESELNRYEKQVRAGKDWTELFPGVASLKLDTTGTGLNVSLRIVKKGGEPITVVPEGTPGATVVMLKRVNELSFYSLSTKDIAAKAGLSLPRFLAIAKHLKLQANEEHFKEFTIGKSVHKRYSPKALEHVKKEIPNLDLEQIWARHKPAGRRAA